MDVWAPPIPVALLTAVPDFSGVIVSWVGSQPATSYRVYRTTLALASFTLLATTLAPGYVDTTAQPGETYLYQVTAVNDAGESFPATPASVTAWLFSDNFKRVSADSLGSQWTNVGTSSFSVQGNLATGGVVTNNNVALCQVSPADGSVSALVDLSPNSASTALSCAVGMRDNGVNQGVFAGLRVLVASRSIVVRLMRRTGVSGYQFLDTGPTTDLSVHKIGLRANGNTITVFLDDVAVLTAVDSQYSAPGFCSLFLSPRNTASNFIVTR